MEQIQGMVSVIMPFFNAEKFLREAVESIFAQTYGHWELLLVDDGCMDGSPAIARELADQGAGRVRCLSHDGRQNRGEAASRNLGCDHARGEYIAMLDADDVWEPNYLAESVAMLAQNRTVGMVYGTTLVWYSWNSALSDHSDWVPELGFPDGTLLPPPVLAAKFIRQEVFHPGPSSVLFRREAVESAGGCEESFRFSYADASLFYKLILRYPVLAADRCWGKYRQHPDSLMRAIRAASAETERLRFLEWFKDELAKIDQVDQRLWKVVNDDLWPYEHPLLHGTKARIEPVLDRIRQWCRAGARSVQGRTAGTITARPNPIPVSGMSSEGVTDLSWSVRGTETVEVRLQSPDGQIFSQSTARGSARTGPWVVDGTVIYLQDAAGGKGSDPASTIARTRVRVLPPRQRHRMRYRPARLSPERYDDEFRTAGLDRFSNGIYQVRNQTLAKWILDVRPSRVFEFAAGGSGLAALLEAGVSEYVWSDFSTLAVESARQHLQKADVRRIDICDEYRSIPWGRYDTVVCVSPGDIPDDLHILAEIAPGARVFLSCAMADESPFTRVFSDPQSARARFGGLFEIRRTEILGNHILVDAIRKDRRHEDRDLVRMFRSRQNFHLRNAAALHRYIARQLSGRVLEVGCSDGYLYPYLRCEKFVGVDLCREAVEEARRRHQAEFLTGGLGDVEHPGPFDSIYFNDILWTRADRVAAVRWFERFQPKHVVVQEKEEVRIELPYRLRSEKRFRLNGADPERFRKRVVRVFDL